VTITWKMSYLTSLWTIRTLTITRSRRVLPSSDKPRFQRIQSVMNPVWIH